MTGRRWLVTGRVQGVGYRAFCVRAARSLGLDGWVRNLADGRVEVVAAGPDDALDRLTTALSEGPRFAAVDNVDVSHADEGDVDGSGFDVRFDP
jgi:acylphosphatase